MTFTGKFVPGAEGYSCLVFAGASKREGSVASGSVSGGALT